MAVAKKDYYEVLGVTKSATGDEIKRAYRKKAHELHPDKSGGDEAKFRELGEAYAVLSDPQKRAQYDQFGHSGPFGAGQPGGAQGYGGFEGFDVGDIFGGFGDIFGQAMRQAMANVQAELEISLPQAVLGDTLEVKLDGEQLKITVPPGAQDGTRVLFRGKGRVYQGGRGDLTVILRVRIPRRLTERERELYEELKKLETEKRAKKFWQR